MHYQSKHYCIECSKIVQAESGITKRGTGPITAEALAYLREPRRYYEIREHLQITNNHASVMLNRLLRYGLVERISRGLYQSKEVPLAGVKAEVKELVDEIRKYGFTVPLESDGYKIYKDGKPVPGDKGVPITLHITPSDNRWRKNVVAELVRAKVLPFDPKKEGQRRVARESRPASVDALTAQHRATLEAKQRAREKWAPTIAAARQLFQDLGVSQHEFAIVMGQIADENALVRPSNKALHDHVHKLLGHGERQTDILTNMYARIWRAVLKHFNVEVPEPEAEPEPEREAVTSGNSQGPQPTKTPHGHKITSGQIQLDPNNILRCIICGFQAKDLRGLRGHQRGHMKQTCKWCGQEQNAAGIGQHQKYCSENPVNGVRVVDTGQPPQPQVPPTPPEERGETRVAEEPQVEQEDQETTRLAAIGQVIDEWWKGDPIAVVTALKDLEAESFKQLLKNLVV